MVCAKAASEITTLAGSVRFAGCLPRLSSLFSPGEFIRIRFIYPDVETAMESNYGLTEQPRIGDVIAWFNRIGAQFLRGTVISVAGNLCWLEFTDGRSAPFIWRFQDGLNKLATVVKEAT